MYLLPAPKTHYSKPEVVICQKTSQSLYAFPWTWCHPSCPFQINQLSTQGFHKPYLCCPNCIFHSLSVMRWGVPVPRCQLWGLFFFSLRSSTSKWPCNKARGLERIPELRGGNRFPGSEWKCNVSGVRKNGAYCTSLWAVLNKGEGKRSSSW